MLLGSGLPAAVRDTSSPDAVVPVAAAGHQAPPREHGKAVHRQQVGGKGRAQSPAAGASNMSRHRLVSEDAASHLAPAVQALRRRRTVRQHLPPEGH